MDVEGKVMCIERRRLTLSGAGSHKSGSPQEPRDRRGRACRSSIGTISPVDAFILDSGLQASEETHLVVDTPVCGDL